MKSYSIILTELFFSWGHFIKPPYLSPGGCSLPYPPPTTLIGALAYPYFKYHGSNKEIEYNRRYYYSPTIKLLEYVKYASLGYLNPRVTQITDINKYFTFAYIRVENRKKEAMWSSVIGVGKTYVLSKAVIAYLVKRDYGEELSKIAWGITRIGSKESLVSVTKVNYIKEPVVIKQINRFETIFPTPASIVKEAQNAEKIVFWKITPEVYSRVDRHIHEIYEEYYVPKPESAIYGGEMTIKVDLNKSLVFQTPYTPLAIPIELIKEGERL